MLIPPSSSMPPATARLTPLSSHYLLPHLKRNWCTSTTDCDNPSSVSPSTLPLMPPPSLLSPPQFVLLPFLYCFILACHSSHVVAFFHPVQGEQGLFFSHCVPPSESLTSFSLATTTTLTSQCTLALTLALNMPPIHPQCAL